MWVFVCISLRRNALSVQNLARYIDAAGMTRKDSGTVRQTKVNGVTSVPSISDSRTDQADAY